MDMSYGWGIQCKTRTVFTLRDVTSRPMFATDTCMMYTYYVARIELSENQSNAEYAKQYRLKRKLLLQHQASTSSETEILQKQKKAQYAKQYRLKRKLMMQQQNSTSTETHSPPSKRRYDGASKT
jgi:hypothetical protein